MEVVIVTIIIIVCIYGVFKISYDLNGIVIPILQLRKLRHMDSVNEQVLRTYTQQTLSWGLRIQPLNKADKDPYLCGNYILMERSKR